jgi:hypothetical protein
MANFKRDNIGYSMNWTVELPTTINKSGSFDYYLEYMKPEGIAKSRMLSFTADPILHFKNGKTLKLNAIGI